MNKGKKFLDYLREEIQDDSEVMEILRIIPESKKALTRIEEEYGLNFSQFGDYDKIIELTDYILKTFDK